MDEEGISDYLILPLPFSDRAHYRVSFATKAAGGFTDDQLTRLAELVPTLASVVEILSVRRIAQNLMSTYLGRKTGQRVLDGMIQRGSTETINAAIWYSDLRGFTYLTDRLPSDVLISLLNDHFERIVGPIEANGGEVLKFMGDALLAIFPIDALGSEAQAATAALHALDGALMATADRNLERRQDGQPEMDFWVALYLGDISYGNIGAADRLDFTVMGQP
jgi:adenylate cyclase